MVKAKFTWTKSVSTNVVKQVLTLTVDGVSTPTDLDVNAESFEVEVQENKSYHAELVAVGHKFSSGPAVADFVTPDLSTPASPTAFVANVEIQ